MYTERPDRKMIITPSNSNIADSHLSVHVMYPIWQISEIKKKFGMHTKSEFIAKFGKKQGNVR